MKTLSVINFVVAALFVACCCYQALYCGVRLFKRRHAPSAKRLCRYGVLICARNEQAVIGQLLESIAAQSYPSGLVDVFVCADNCTDDTAQIARRHGARVYERQNKLQVGKGYALRFLLEKIGEDMGLSHYDGFFVFDADNLLDAHYIEEMNKVFSSGYKAVTGYRNTKNFGDNWITAGYGLWFLRESEYMNRPRADLGVSCAVSGTGFLFSPQLLQNGGVWDYFLLTEDLEFTADMIARGEKIGYCGTAILYDEQPRSFRQSIRQRSRWVKGYLQVVAKHGPGLLRTLISTGSFACYDTLMTTIPACVLTVCSFAVNTGMFVLGMLGARGEMGLFFQSVLSAVINSYLLMFVMGLLPLITEWKKIYCSRGKKIRYAFTYPLFVFSFGLAMVLAVFGNIQWQPIQHTVAVSIGEMGPRGRK